MEKTQAPSSRHQVSVFIADCVTLGKLRNAFEWETSWLQSKGKARTPGGDGAESEASWSPGRSESWQLLALVLITGRRVLPASIHLAIFHSFEILSLVYGIFLFFFFLYFLVLMEVPTF